MRVGLVLGAGGVQGGAWLTGALDAIAEETGWDPASADYIVGTSAGSMLATLIAAGLPPWFMVAHSKGETFAGMTDARGGVAGDADRAGGARYHLERGAIPWFPGSPELIVRSAVRPHRHTLPLPDRAGRREASSATSAARDRPHRRRRELDLPPNHRLVVACDYATGRRATFGRKGAPDAHIEDAVAALLLDPLGFYRPVRIGDRSYVDGGIWSASNLDVLRGLELDLVICFQPDVEPASDPRDQPGRRLRARLQLGERPAARLGGEAPAGGGDQGGARAADPSRTSRRWA